MLESVTECYRVLQSITENSRVLQNIKEYYRVFLAHLLGPISGLVYCEGGGIGSLILCGDRWGTEDHSAGTDIPYYYLCSNYLLGTAII